jgi:hypothetical protein
MMASSCKGHWTGPGRRGMWRRTGRRAILNARMPNDPCKPHRSLRRWTITTLALVGLALPVAAQDAGVSPLRCAVEGATAQLPSKALCDQLGKALGRPVQLVDDARKDKRGEALQIVRDDVQWAVVLLRKGAVRSWTRVSVDDARGREVQFFSRAVRSLLKTAPKGDAPCVRLDPKQRSERAPDLVYPWADLKPCVRQVVDVVDPWWTTGK